MFSGIYSYMTSFYYTEPTQAQTELSTQIIDKIDEPRKNEEKIEENVSNELDIDEKKVYYNNFKKKQNKAQKNKKNKRKINKH